MGFKYHRHNFLSIQPVNSDNPEVRKFGVHPRREVSDPEEITDKGCREQPATLVRRARKLRLPFPRKIPPYEFYDEILDSQWNFSQLNRIRVPGEIGGVAAHGAKIGQVPMVFC